MSDQNSTPFPKTQTFRAAAPDDLVWHELDSMTLLYHRPSGITHMLADPAPAMLEVMGTDELTPAQIAARLRKIFDVDASADTENIVLARLEELCALGVVSRVAN